MIRAAQDTAGTLNDRLITVIGFTLPETDGVDLGRVVIICCAADAQLARIHLRGPGGRRTQELPRRNLAESRGHRDPRQGRRGFDVDTDIAGRQSATRIEAPANTYA